MTVVSFTGHTQIGEHEPAIRRLIRTELVRIDPSGAKVGGAAGVDTIAAEVCAEMEIPFELCLPDRGYKSYWILGRGWTGTEIERALWSARFDAVVDLAETVTYVNANYPRKGNNFRRNTYMVQHSDLTIALRWHASPGTDHCIAVAHKLGREVILLNPPKG